MLINRKFVLVSLLVLLVAGLGGYTLLINPDNPFTRLFQRKISDVTTRIVIGPYPVERDFRLLAANRVTLIVSLLDPAIPYEKTLLEKEGRLALQYGMRLKNFPMSSILGRKFGGYYEGSAAKAAAAIAGTSDKVYVHCYLGLHRIQAVRDLLDARGVASGTYNVRRAERDKVRLVLDGAEAAYNGKRYEEALARLAQVSAAALPPEGRLLQAWSHYQLGQLSAAAGQFAAERQATPGAVAPVVGSGYCALRAGRLDVAEQDFTAAIRRDPSHADALGGLGLVQYRAGRRAEAIRSLEAALQQAPNNQEFRDVLEQARRPLAK